MPADVAASVVLKQAFTHSTEDDTVDYYHLENPVTTPWSEIAEAISRYNGADLPLVPLKEWLSKLREHGIEDVEKVPAIRLVDFYESLGAFPALDVSNTLEIAPEVNYGRICSDLMTRYLRYQSV